MALKHIDLTGKCGSCCYFKPIEDTATGECLKNPYDESVVHDPKYPHWIVQRSRIKCPLYDQKSQTNADRIRAMSDEELAQRLYMFVGLEEQIHFCPSHPECDALLDTESGIPDEKCVGCLLAWLRKPAEEVRK